MKIQKKLMTSLEQYERTERLQEAECGFREKRNILSWYIYIKSMATQNSTKKNDPSYESSVLGKTSSTVDEEGGWHLRLRMSIKEEEKAKTLH